MTELNIIESAHISKLDGTNYQNWKFQLNILLRGKGLAKEIEQALSKAKLATGEAEELARSTDDKAQYYITSSCDDKRLNELITCSSAYQMWQKLAVHHASNAKVNKNILWQQFFQFTFNEDETATANISELELIAAKRRDMNEVVTEASIVTKLIITLPASFNNLEAARDNLSDEQQTL
jgi:gag-polypeptide of LTR copia-type